jgi:hypothetical protein
MFIAVNKKPEVETKYPSTEDWLNEVQNIHKIESQKVP